MELPTKAQISIANHVAGWVESHLKYVHKLPVAVARKAGIDAGNKAAQAADLSVRESETSASVG